MDPQILLKSLKKFGGFQEGQYLRNANLIFKVS